MSGSFFFGTPDGVISQPGEIDTFAVPLVGGVNYTAYAHGAASAGSGLTLTDPAILIFDANGNLLGGQDDMSGLLQGVFGNEPFYQFNAPSSGTFYVGVADLDGGVGSYTWGISASGPPVMF
jgi:hypothetical protein